MHSVRDVFNRMPASRSELEDKVLSYSPELRSKIEKDINVRSTLEKIAGEEYDNYKPYIGGWTAKVGAAGRAVGYAADGYFAATLGAGIVPALGGKAINLIAQLPEKLYKSISYAVHTGGYLGAIQNILEGAISYLPGATFLDEGLSRIAQKRMLKKTLYRVSEELGVKIEPWYRRMFKGLKEEYEDVKDRVGNIVGPYKPQPAFARV